MNYKRKFHKQQRNLFRHAPHDQQRGETEKAGLRRMLSHVAGLTNTPNRDTGRQPGAVFTWGGWLNPGDPGYDQAKQIQGRGGLIV